MFFFLLSFIPPSCSEGSEHFLVVVCACVEFMDFQILLVPSLSVPQEVLLGVPEEALLLSLLPPPAVFKSLLLFPVPLLIVWTGGGSSLTTLSLAVLALAVQLILFALHLQSSTKDQLQSTALSSDWLEVLESRRQGIVRRSLLRLTSLLTNGFFSMVMQHSGSGNGLGWKL